MAITETDLKYYLAEVTTEGSTNGGRFSWNEAITGVSNNVWDDVTKEERDAGDTRHMKLFFKNNSVNDDRFSGITQWNEIPTPADDWVLMYPGTPTDTQATMVTTRAYGAGALKTSVSAAATSIIVTVEDASMTGIFADTDQIRISSKSSPSSSSGDAEFATIDGTPSVSGLDVTIPLADGLTNAYLSGVRVHSCMPQTAMQALASSYVTTSSAGTFADDVEGINYGAIDETITLTLAEAGLASAGLNYTVTGSISGTLTTGNTGTDYTAEDGSSRGMWIALAASFGGTFAIGDTIVFDMASSVAPFWLQRVIPTGATYLSANYNSTVTYGQAA